MRLRDWSAAPFIRPAAAALALATLLLLWSVARLASAGAVPDDPTPRDVLRVPTGALPAPAATRAEPLDDDPFSPDRSAPARRYALPGDLPNDGGPPAPRPTLLGTALAGGAASFATARLGAEPPKILHVGERIGPYTLRAIARGRATFTDADGEPFDVRAGAPPAPPTAPVSR